MRVLWISQNIPYPPRGGVLQRNYNLLRQVAKVHEVYLIAFNQSIFLSSEIEMKNAMTALKEFCRAIEVVTIPTDRWKYYKQFLLVRSLLSKKPYTVLWTKDKLMGNLVARVRKSFNPDLIYYDTIGLAEYCDFSPNQIHVLNHHNIESAMMLRRAKKELNLLAKVYLLQEAKKIRMYEQKVCSLFHLNMVVSDLDSVTLENIMSGSRVALIPNGVDLEYFSPSEMAKNDKSMVFAGGMNWYPNREAMLFFARELWPLIKQNHPDASMNVIGRSPPAELRKLALSDSAFRVLGFVEDVRQYMNKSMVYVCPIQNGGGTRLKILDALSMGIPIVATTLAIEGLPLEPERHVLVGDTPQVFTSQINRLFDSLDLRRRLAEEGRKFVKKNYDWSIIGKLLNFKLLKLFENKAKPVNDNRDMERVDENETLSKNI